MKTLIIHPKDESTTFLDIVYKDIPNKTVVQGGVTKTELLKMMEQHDRIMMMGHGAPGGLFSVGKFPYSGFKASPFIIDHYAVPILQEKNDNVFIWCNADKFVDYHNLKGFYSGMFISEVGEALYCGLPNTQQREVDESNYGFVNIISKHINETTETIYENVKKEYGLIAENGNQVAVYNNHRLYVK